MKNPPLTAGDQEFIRNLKRAHRQAKTLLDSKPIKRTTKASKQFYNTFFHSKSPES